MSNCVLDTDVVITAVDRRDSHHFKAAKAIKAMVEEGRTLAAVVASFDRRVRRALLKMGLELTPHLS